MTTETTLHPFTTKGLGQAPFHFDFCDSEGNKENSSCDFCSTPIKYRFFIRSIDGKQSKVGSDCIHKMDSGLYLAIKNQKKALVRAERTRIVNEGKKSKREKNRAEFAVLFPEINAFLLTCIGDNNLSLTQKEQEIGRSLYYWIGERGSLSDNQIALVNRIISKEPKKSGAFIGQIGDKMKGIELTLKFLTSFEGQFGLYWIISLLDAAGNEYVYKGASTDWMDVEGYFPEYGYKDYKYQGPIKKGWKIKLNFKIKAHEVYNGINQNVIGFVKQAK